jgi:AcrR family transcriptional regulator
MSTTGLPPERATAPLPERMGQIFAAAYDLFLAQGYHQTSMDAIAERAGLAKGTLYWYFKGKRELFIALFRHVTSSIVAPWGSSESGETPAERIAAGMAHFRDAADQVFQIARIMVQARAIDIGDEEITAIVDETVADAASVIEEIIAAGVARGEFRPVPARGMSLAIIALVTGLALLTGGEGRREQWPELVSAVEALVSGGLLPAAES